MLIFRLKIFFYTFRLVNAFRRWMDRVSRTTKTYMSDVTKCDKHEFETLSNDLVLHQQCFIDLSVQRNSCFTDLMIKDNSDRIDNCWSQCERKWHALHSQVRLLGDLLENRDGVNHIMSDFDALESWLDENEMIMSSNNVDSLGASDDEKRIDQAISHQNNLEDFLEIQNEKLNTVCQKADSFKRTSNISSDSTKDVTSSVGENTSSLQNNENLNSGKSLSSYSGEDEKNRNNISSNLLDPKYLHVSKDSNSCIVSNNENEGEIDSSDNNNNKNAINNNNNKPKGLLKKDRAPSTPKKRVVFSTTHEFSDCHTIQTFSQLNDEYDDQQYRDNDEDLFYDFHDDDDFYYDRDDFGDVNDDDDIVFSEDSYYPQPPQQFLQLSDSEDGGKNSILVSFMTLEVQSRCSK